MNRILIFKLVCAAALADKSGDHALASLLTEAVKEIEHKEAGLTNAGYSYAVDFYRVAGWM